MLALASLVAVLQVPVPQVPTGVAPADSRQSAAQAEPIRIDAHVDKERIALGDPFTLTIAIEHPTLDTYSLPQPLSLGQLALRGPPQVSRTRAGDHARTTFTIPLADYLTLEPQIPAITLSADGPEGPRQLTLPPHPLELRSLVAEERAPNPEHAHHGPKPPVPVLVRSYLWAWLAGVLVLAAAGGYAFLLVRRRRAALLALPKPPPTPEEEALGRLVALKRRAPWERGLARAAVFELSEIVREYLGRRLRFSALDLTTDELVDELKRRRILGLDLAELCDEFAWQDMVKFAKAEPTAEECVRSIDRAASLVDRARGFLPSAPPPASAMAGAPGAQPRPAAQSGSAAQPGTAAHSASAAQPGSAAKATAPGQRKRAP